MITFIFTSIICLLCFIRGLRWLAILQQKEYRLDRFRAFLTTREGALELLRLIPMRDDFTRTGMKRPVLTNRILLTAVLSAGFSCLVFISLIFTTNLSWTSAIVLIYMFLPFLIAASVLPTTILSFVLTKVELMKAKEKIKKNSPKIIGITGSYGKTSTKHLVAHLLKAKYTVFTTPASHNTKYSIAKAINNSYAGEEIVVLEYAAYTATEIKELTEWFAPDSAIITGLAPQHLELFGSIKNIIKAKADLIKALPADAPVYYFAEDDGAKKIVEAGVLHKVLVTQAVSLRKAQITDYSLNSVDGRLTIQTKENRVNTRLVGQQYVPAIALAIKTALDLGLTLKECERQLKTFAPNKNFITSYTLKNGALIIDDGGSANPKGAQVAFDLIKNTVNSKKNMYLIFPGIVDLGQQSDEIHAELAKSARETFRQTLYVGSTGKAQFSVYPDFVIDTKEDIIHTIKTAGVDTAFLIEGRMPGWLLHIISTLKINN